MTKENFSIAGVTSLAELSPGARIHFIGICGVAMAPLAIALQNQGFRVSGSDKEFYEPMGSLLSNSGVKLASGYAAGNISDEIDLVVIGNAVSYGHVEVAEVERLELAYTFSAKLLADLMLLGHTSLVVAGTHGKSTTTTLLCTALHGLGEDSSFFVGALPKAFPLSIHLGKSHYSAVEGDEYDSAFFAKQPKFNFYQPHSCIITSIEFDHADIYPDLVTIEKQFENLIMALPTNGKAVCCLDCKNVAKLIGKLSENHQSKIVTYGKNSGAQYCLQKIDQQGLNQVVTARLINNTISFKLPLVGEYNSLNALAVIALLHQFGFEVQEIANALGTYQGLRRRQDIRLQGERVTLIDDFAHHPTAVRETLAGIRAAYPTSRIWAVFEPRSNTSRRKIFQDDYVKAFTSADLVLLCNVEKRGIDEGQELLDVSELTTQISANNVAASCLPDSKAIAKKVLAEVKTGDVVVVMSNGGFGGLVAYLEEGLKKI